MKAVPCSICGAPAKLAYRHPEANLHRCPECDHCFADLDSLETFESYDTDYGEVEHKNWFENPNLDLFDFISRSLGPSVASVLDVGCGRGAFLQHLRRLRPDLQLAGIDVTPHESSSFEFIQGDFLAHSFARQFDAVVSLAVIEHVTDPHAFVQQLRAACKPNGLLAIMTLNDRSVLYSTARAMRRLGLRGPFNQLYSKHHLNHFNQRSLARLLELCGLRIEQRYDHHIPANAIDFPARGAIADGVRRLGAQATFLLGDVTGRAYLQTVLCRVLTTPSR